MPNCHTLVPCRNSVLDQYSNTWTTVEIAEVLKVQLPTPQENLVAPFDIVTFWRASENDIGLDFETKLVWNNEDGDSVRELVVSTFVPQARVHRIRFRGFELPPSGEYLLVVHVRAHGQPDWVQCTAEWPMTVEVEVLEAEED